MRVPLAVPFWSSDTYRSIARLFVSGAVVDGFDLHDLESALIERLNVASALLCGSGSLALEIALRACAVAPGDEVIIPAFSCSSVVPPILALKAVPVLADIGAELNLTADTIDAAITGKTRAVIVPHLYGNPADMAPIVELARAKAIRVIDDAAQALGATLDGRRVGGFGDFGVVSFGKEKICFGLGGGAVVGREADSIDKDARRLSWPPLTSMLAKLADIQLNWRWRRWTLPLRSALGRRDADPAGVPDTYHPVRMTNLQAAVGLSLIRTLEENIAARRERVAVYRKLLGNQPGLELVHHGSGSACLAQVVRVLPRRRNHDAASELIEVLGESGCEVQGSYVPIHVLGCYRECVWDSLPRTERFWPDLIELPCEPSVALTEVERISAVVTRFCRINDRRMFRRKAAVSTASDGLC